MSGIGAGRVNLGISLNVASLSLFCRYCCGRCSPELAALVPFPYFRWRSTRYFDRLYGCKVVNSFFHRAATFWNTLPAECLSLIYVVNIFKSRNNRNLSIRFSYVSHMRFIIFIVALQPWMECIPISKEWLMGV